MMKTANGMRRLYKTNMYDEEKEYNSEPTDTSNFLDEMRRLYESDPEEAAERLREEGYTVEDLELDSEE